MQNPMNPNFVEEDKRTFVWLLCPNGVPTIVTNTEHVKRLMREEGAQLIPENEWPYGQDGRNIVDSVPKQKVAKGQ